MIRAIHVSNDFEPLSGGISTHLKNLMPSLAKNNVEPILLVPQSTADKRREIYLDERYTDFRVIRIPYRSSKNPINTLIRLTQATREGLEWIEQQFGKPDIIHQHDSRATRLGATQHARKMEIPIIWTNHSSGFFRKTDFTARMLAHLPGIHPDGLVVVHRMMEERFENEWSDCPVTYIPNGVNPDHFQTGKKEKNSKTKVLFPQRMIPGKGAEELAEAAALLLSEDPEASIQFRFAGSEAASNRDSSTIERVRKILSPWIETDAVQFLGNLPYREMLQEYIYADMVVLPFKMGTESLSLFEAWASGTPVISVYLEEANKFVRADENCLLLDEAEPGKIVSAIQRLMSDPVLSDRLAQSGLRMARSECRWEQRAENTKDFYEDILAGRRSE
ncbi:MAG: glycosyltransferase [Bacteroidetes bacterium]|jgi:glycosyltransferase involved in cell wall biosynthesis|nr:glycosyltransferase [Bacteroidota bacterium]